MTKSSEYDKIYLPLVNRLLKSCKCACNSEFIEKAGAAICTQLLKPAESSIRLTKETLSSSKSSQLADETVTFDKVVALGADDGLKVGTPYVDGAAVEAKVIKNGKAKKITVFTYKPKKGEKKKQGHRQPYTQVKIEAIKA